MAKLSIPEVSVGQMKEILKEFFLNPDLPQSETQMSPVLWGAPGVGKSYIINELAKELDAVVIPLFGSGADETETDGIPVPNTEKKVVEYLPLETQNFPKDKMCIWLWDEINRARPEVIQSLFKIISTYPRTIGVRPIPKNVYIVLCANEGENDGTIVTDFNDSSFFNKLAHFKIKFDRQEFFNYISNKYENHTDKYLAEGSKRLGKYFKYYADQDKACLLIPQDPSKERAYPTPRTIERFLLTFRRPLAEYIPKNADSKRRLMYGASIVGVDWISELCSTLDDMLKVEDLDKTLISAKKIYNDCPDQKAHDKYSKEISNADPARILKWSEEIVEIFENISRTDIEKKMNGFKLKLFCDIINSLPIDSRRSKADVLLENNSFTDCGNIYGKDNPMVKKACQELLKVCKGS